jgi:CBS domain containing-hemolysin-like protein
VEKEPSSQGQRWRRRNRRAAEQAAPESQELRQRTEIAENLAALSEIQIREVMTPRVDVETLETPVTAMDVAREVRASGHSCYPVVLDDLDDVVGLLFVKDLFRAGPGDFLEAGSGLSTLEISKRVRPPLLLPESIDVLEALSEMRAKRRSVALVVDEYGGVAGIVSLKDLLEPLVGDLTDELANVDDPEVSRIDATRWLVNGQITLDDLADEIGLDLPDGEYVTLGGYLLDTFGRIPDEGDELSIDEWSFRIQTMEKRRIDEVLIAKIDHDSITLNPQIESDNQ